MSDELMAALRAEDDGETARILRGGRKEDWSVERLLPFVLRKCLLRQKWDADCLKYITQCFNCLSDLLCLNEDDLESCAEIHRLSLLLQGVFTIQHSHDNDKCSDDVMILYNELNRCYETHRYGKQFTYLVTVCQRKSRFANFQKGSEKLLNTLKSRLKKQAIPLVDHFISNMQIY